MSLTQTGCQCRGSPRFRRGRQSRGRTTVLEGLRRLDMLSYPEVIEQAPAVLTKLDKPLNGWIYDIMGQPAWKAKTEPVVRLYHRKVGY